MSTPVWIRDTGVRVAIVAAAIAALTVGWVLVSAFRPESLPAASARDVVNVATIASTARQAPVDVDAVVDGDVFSSDRTAPSVRYRLPNESRASDAPAPEPEKPEVLGTAVATDGRSFATVRLGDGNPTLVHVGERIGEWIVREIERGKIVLVSANGVRANIGVPKPGN